jgi:predicted transcriptional regulator
MEIKMAHVTYDFMTNNMTTVKATALDKEYYSMLLRASKKYDHYDKTWKLYNYAVDITQSHSQALNIAFQELWLHTEGMANFYYDGEGSI